MAFQKEPLYLHGQAAKTAVLYCNLGTPKEPTAPALRQYLAQFLGDSRVVEIPKAIWWLILHGIFCGFDLPNLLPNTPAFGLQRAHHCVFGPKDKLWVWPKN
jgi:protoheme ferro-lyase